MAQGEDVAQAAARLEAALERIAYSTDRGRAVEQAAPGVERPMTPEGVERLDALIAQLRRALAGGKR